MSISIDTHPQNKPHNWLKTTSRNSPKVQTLMKNLSVLEKALVGAAGGAIAGAFTYVCLHRLDTIKTKLQTEAAFEIFKNAFDVVLKTFQSKGILGLYTGVSAMVVGSSASSAVYFGTCEFGAISSTITTLLDVFTTRLVTQVLGDIVNKVTAAMYGGVRETATQILKEEGWVGFTCGMSPRVLHNACFSALGCFVFETARLTILMARLYISV